MFAIPPAICVAAEEPLRRAEARALARRLGVDLCAEVLPAPGFSLVYTAERLELRAPQERVPAPVAVDLVAELGRVGRKLLLRAVGRRQPTAAAALAIDATAGLGSDSAVLAARGYRVIALERSPLVAALLADGLARTSGHAVLGRIELRVGDALSLIPTLPLADVILLDPMFPERGKSALKDKGMRALRALVGDDLDASALLAVARRYVGRRVVVKRPLGAGPPRGAAPSGAIRGTTVRYDIYPPQR